MMKFSAAAAATMFALAATMSGALAQAQQQKGPAPAAPVQAPQKGPAPQRAALPPQSSVAPAAIAAAKELLVLKNASAVYQGAVVATITNVRNSLTQSNINLQKDLEEVSLKLARDLTGRESEILDGMAVIYATNFGEQEIKDLVAFYKTPLGKKTLEMEPKSIEQSLNYMRNWTEDLAQEINERYRDELKKRGKDL
jgi:uncharacterized protein